MKIFEFFKYKILNILMAVSFTGVISVCVSCADSTPDMPNDENRDDEMTISLLIPDYEGSAGQFGARSFDLTEEGYMSNLYVVAIKEYEAGSNVKLSEPIFLKYALNPVGYNFIPGEIEYKEFNIRLTTGKYRFYVVANFGLYLKRQNTYSDFTSEEDLRSIVLNYTYDTPLSPAHLPMACMPNEIMTAPKNSNGSYGTPVGVGNDNLVEITSNYNRAICADMRFLCSKVRYTILFDKTPNGISSKFGESWIRFNVDDNIRPTATNIRKQTVFDPSYTGELDLDTKDVFINQPISQDNTKEYQLATWNLDIDRYKWHKDGADYPKSASSTLDPWDDTTDKWLISPQKVWQGVTYLPENNDGNERTFLEFPYHYKKDSSATSEYKECDSPKRIVLFGDNVNEEHYASSSDSGNFSSSNGDNGAHGLRRGYMYDVVAKVKNPDNLDLDIRVFVNVLPWNYHVNDKEWW